MAYIGKLVELYNRSLADGLDRLASLVPNDSQGLDEPFTLDSSVLRKLAGKPANHQAAYLVDLAKVEALDTVGENQKAVELLDQHV